MASVCSLVRKRQHGLCGTFEFERRVSQFLQEDKELLMDPELVSPHRTSISSLDVDMEMSRFVLAGSADGTISVYDLSKWGSEGFSKQSATPNSWMRFRPVARSIKTPLGLEDSEDPLFVPSGHAASVTHVQWYPVDTGAFISCASDGKLLLWDTNRMEPVLHVDPFEASQEEPTGAAWGSAHLQTGGDHSVVATGSWHDSAVKLVDIRSGSSSHQLPGHSQGITAVQWSPTMPHVLASGSKDGTIRMWDIRKSGSQASIAVLSRDFYGPSGRRLIEPSYKADYSHLRKLAIEIEKKKFKKRKLAHPSTTRHAPNNYDHIQRKGGQEAHNGHVAALAFLPGGQSLASIGGGDGEVSLWDLRYGPLLKDSKFMTPTGRPAATPRMRKVALCIDSNETLWVGHGTEVLGFSFEGGTPKQILRGHLNSVTAVDLMRSDKYLLTGSRDGMILSWGKPKASLFTRRPIVTQDKDSW